MEHKITDDNFEAEVLNSELPVLVDFYADWCGPCKMMAPIIEGLAQTFEGKCKIGKCNTDENMNLVNKYKIMSIPTIIIFKGGEAVATSIGVTSKTDLENKIQEVL